MHGEPECQSLSFDSMTKEIRKYAYTLIIIKHDSKSVHGGKAQETEYIWKQNFK